MDFRNDPNVRATPNIRSGEILGDETIQSQYSASPTIIALVHSSRVRIKPDADIKLFYDCIFNIETAQGIGLDIWGRILGIGRLLDVEDAGEWFGFLEADYDPFNVSPMWDGSRTTIQTELADDAYRYLLMWKALANISTADAASLNNLLLGLFPGMDVVVHEVGPMAIELYVFFPLEPYQRAVLDAYGLFAKGAGVGFNWCEIPEPVFGFNEAGYEPFDTAPFWTGQTYDE